MKRLNLKSVAIHSIQPMLSKPKQSEGEIGLAGSEALDFSDTGQPKARAPR